jgi:hypothetical protein
MNRHFGHKVLCRQNSPGKNHPGYDPKNNIFRYFQLWHNILAKHGISTLPQFIWFAGDER